MHSFVTKNLLRMKTANTLTRVLDLALCLALSAPVVQAVPAKPGLWRNITLADGRCVEAQLTGDEHAHFWRTADGCCYERSAAAADRYVPVGMAEIIGRATASRERTYGALTSLHRGPRRLNIGDTHEPYVGKKRCLCILVQYKDVKFQASNTVELFNSMLNEVGYTNDSLGHVGSVRDYFLAQSDGVFDIEFDIAGPIDLPYNRAYYGANDNSGHDKNPSAMIRSAFMLADSQVNFKDYDWDGDGYCEAVYVLYAGAGEADGGGEDCVWPHKSTINYVQHDGVLCGDYACGPELNGIGGLSGIGTMCHEYSHCLGLPDFYDTAYGGNYGSGSWDIMCSGSYNGDSNVPAGYTAYERWYAGWLEPEELTTDTEVSGMKPLTSGGQSYIVRNDAYPNEYYLLENRALEGWDSRLYGSGLLIYHVDFSQRAWMFNLVNDTKSFPNITDHQRFYIFCADNSTTEGTPGAIAGDAFPTQTNNLLVNGSRPSAMLYHPNSEGNYTMDKPIYNIVKAADGTVSFTFENRVGQPSDAPSGALFYEGFSFCGGTGGNDGVFNKGSNSPIITDNPGWSAGTAFGASKCGRYGSNTQRGMCTTPEFTIDGSCVLIFKAAPYATDGGNLTLAVADGEAELEQTSVTMERGQWTTFTVVLTGTGTVRVKFTAQKRFFLDEVLVLPTELLSVPLTTASPTPVRKSFNLKGQRVGEGYRGIVVSQGRKTIVK